jgi:hypothetical protein
MLLVTNPSASTRVKQFATLSTIEYENESAKVIEEVKNTISSIIKEVVASNQNSTNNSSLEDIVKLIKDSIPSDIAIKSLKVNEKELQSKIRETVGELLTEKEIQSVVRLRNNTKNNIEQGISSVATISITSKNLSEKSEEVHPTEAIIIEKFNIPSGPQQKDTGEDNITKFIFTTKPNTIEDVSLLVDIPNFNPVAYSTAEEPVTESFAAPSKYYFMLFKT